MPSSVEALQWLQQYRKLIAKKAEGLSQQEEKLLQELEAKISKHIEPHGKGPPPRRTDLRVRTHLEVAIKDAGDMKRLFIKNISGGGLYVETHQLEPVGKKFELDLALPGSGRIIQLMVEVAWANPKRVGDLPPGMGVKFLNLSDGDRKLIQKLVTQQVEAEIKKTDTAEKKPT